MIDRPVLYRVLLPAGLIAVIPLLPYFPPYWLTLLNYIGIFALIVMGLGVLSGVGGMTSFGQAAFAGFGAYAAALVTLRYGYSPWLGLPAALLASGGAAWGIGLISVRLSGHYLPLGTLAWGIGFYYLFGNLAWIGGHDGLSGLPPLDLFGFDFTDSSRSYYVVWACVGLGALATARLLDSRIGRSLRALRHGADAAASFGVSVPRAKLILFVHAALLAGVAGWLYAHVQRAVTPSAFGLHASIEFLFMAVLGGSGSVWGAIIGAGLVTGLRDHLQTLLTRLIDGPGNFEGVVFGIILVVLLQRARAGIWPLIDRLLPKAPPVEPNTVAEPLPPRPRPRIDGPLLEVSAARKLFGGLVAVNGVSFSVRPGEIAGLIGPNGAGKSTSFNLVTGVLPLSGGTVRFAGSRIDGLAPPQIAARGIARSFQHVKLIPDMSVLENVALGAHLRGRCGLVAALLHLDRDEEERIRAEAARQIVRTGLGPHMHKPAGALALGQQRIVEIARTMCLDPALLLLDEPAAGLRHGEKQELGDLLLQLRGEGMTILLVEHDMGFVMRLTDHIVVLDFGTKIAEGPPAEIRAHPAVLEAYLGGVA